MLTYFSGTVGCGKSLEIHSTWWKNKDSKSIAIIKPSFDTRNGNFIHTRHGDQSLPCAMWDNDTDLFDLLQSIDDGVPAYTYDMILVDEVQFLSIKQINQLFELSNMRPNNLKIYMFGLNKDFKGKMFPSSIRVFEVCDHYVEIKSTCWCGADAKQNAKVLNGEMITGGDSIEIGYNFVPLCNMHFSLKRLK